MDEQAFRAFLTQHGNKAEHFDELVEHVRDFEAFLTRRGGSLAAATPQDLAAFTRHIEERRPGKSPKRVRGIALYYEWQGNTSMGPAARELVPARHQDAEGPAGSEISGAMPANNAAGQGGVKPKRSGRKPGKQGARTSLKDPLAGDDSSWGMDGR